MFIEDKERVMKAVREMRVQDLYFNEDFLQAVIEKRKNLLPKMKKAREEGKIAYLSYDRLVIREKSSR